MSSSSSSTGSSSSSSQRPSQAGSPRGVRATNLQLFMDRLHSEAPRPAVASGSGGDRGKHPATTSSRRTEWFRRTKRQREEASAGGTRGSESEEEMELALRLSKAETERDAARREVVETMEELGRVTARLEYLQENQEFEKKLAVEEAKEKAVQDFIQSADHQMVMEATRLNAVDEYKRSAAFEQDATDYGYDIALQLFAQFEKEMAEADPFMDLSRLPMIRAYRARRGSH